MVSECAIIFYHFFLNYTSFVTHILPLLNIYCALYILTFLVFLPGDSSLRTGTEMSARLLSAAEQDEALGFEVDVHV